MTPLASNITLTPVLKFLIVVAPNVKYNNLYFYYFLMENITISAIKKSLIYKKLSYFQKDEWFILEQL